MVSRLEKIIYDKVINTNNFLDTIKNNSAIRYCDMCKYLTLAVDKGYINDYNFDRIALKLYSIKEISFDSDHSSYNSENKKLSFSLLQDDSSTKETFRVMTKLLMDATNEKEMLSLRRSLNQNNSIICSGSDLDRVMAGMIIFEDALCQSIVEDLYGRIDKYDIPKEKQINKLVLPYTTFYSNWEQFGELQQPLEMCNESFLAITNEQLEKASFNGNIFIKMFDEYEKVGCNWQLFNIFKNLAPITKAYYNNPEIEDVEDRTKRQLYLSMNKQLEAVKEYTHDMGNHLYLVR